MAKNEWNTTWKELNQFLLRASLGSWKLEIQAFFAVSQKIVQDR